jgi:signal transduction histidine kinase
MFPASHIDRSVYRGSLTPLDSHRRELDNISFGRRQAFHTDRTDGTEGVENDVDPRFIGCGLGAECTDSRFGDDIGRISKSQLESWCYNADEDRWVVFVSSDTDTFAASDTGASSRAAVIGNTADPAGLITDATGESFAGEVDLDIDAFHDELRQRNLPIVFWTAVIFNPTYLLWSVFDYFLAPDEWGFFLILRICGVAINSVVALVVVRSDLKRYSWEAFWTISFVYSAFVGVMLPYSGENLTSYIMGFAVILFGAGILPFWPPRWGVTFNLAAASFALLYFSLAWEGSEVELSDVVTGSFVVLTALGLSIVAAIFKYNLARRDYFSRVRLAATAQRESEARLSLAETSHDLEQALEKLKELDRLKSKFFANISHELRTPLTLILAPVEELESRPRDAHDRQQIRVIRRNAERLLGLINDLLDLSRLDAGGLRLNLAEMNIRSVAAAVHENSVPAALARELDFQLTIEPSEREIWGDAHRLEIVLTNLVSNAIKFTPHGGRVEIKVQDRADAVRIEVTDNGPGIPSEDLSRVFERFFQVNPADRRREGGVGIGLALAQELVELHGGTISVTSEPDVATTFAIDLPFGREHISPDVVERRQRFAHAPELKRRTEDRGVPDLEEPATEIDPFDLDEPDDTAEPIYFDGSRRPRILLVEDHDEVRDFIRTLLEPNYDMVIAEDGQQALDLVRNDPPDLVVSDVMMPVMSGTELCRAIKSDPRYQTTPVILLTARVGSEATLEAYAHGADDFVPKPFHPRVLMARIRAQLKLRALGIHLAQQEKLAAVGTLAAGILHEVRNPVNSIVNAGKVLSSRMTAEASDRELLEVIVDGGERIERITSALDTHARPAEAGFSEQCDVRLGLDATLRLLSHKMDGVTVEREYRSERLVRAAAGPLNQVFLNLLDNALRSNAHTLWLEVIDTGDNVRISVSDNGPGVAPEDAGRIFDPFFTKRTDGTGTGLGLYLSRQIVEQLDGSLHLEDRPGGGARFVVELPAFLRPVSVRHEGGSSEP